MHKELIISIIIIIAIIVTNSITQKFTQNTISTVSESLQNVKTSIEKIENEKENPELAQKRANETQEKWHISRDKLAYYIEHDEIEKMETELVAMVAYIEQEEYAEAVASIERAKYIIEHIQEKEKLTLINIF